MNWLLFLPQLPASPSTLRVTIWRRMRAAGALGFQNGVWILPVTLQNKQFVETQSAYISQQGALSYAFEVAALNPSVEELILAGFRAERYEEYTEFCERCEVLIAELNKETVDEKFTFAELEETEADLQKLESWFKKITGRDFIGGNQKQAALVQLERCHETYKGFEAKVYAQQGVNPTDSSE